MRSNVEKMSSPKIDRPRMMSLIIEARVTSYEGFIYLSQETTFSVHWSTLRLLCNLGSDILIIAAASLGVIKQ